METELSRLLHALEPTIHERPQTPVVAASDGFMFNLGAVLLQLCDPLTNPASSHASKIDPTYVLSTHRLSLQEDTKLCATTDDVMYWLDPRNPDLRNRYLARMAEAVVEPEPEGSEPLAVSESFGTISEYFFLTMRVLHVGMLSSFAILEKISNYYHRTAQEINSHEQQLRSMRVAAAGQQAPHLAMLEKQLEQMRSFSEQLKRSVLCYQAQLLEPQLLQMAIRYYRLVSRWLVQIAQPPAEGLPLPAKVPRLFAALPEHTMDDVAQFFKYLTQFAPSVLEELATDELHDFLTLMVTFIGSPAYVKNPYLRARFTTLLRYLVPRSEDNDSSGHGSERLAAVFHSHALAKRALAPAIMQFFVDIEFTGSHTGAYDKYTYRHEMNQILDYFWSLQEYRQAMVGFTRDTQRFVRFVNMMINDSIYSMDEALTKLTAIKALQAEMEDEAAWARQPRQQAMQRRRQMEQDESSARYFMVFTCEVLHMIEYLSSDKEVAAVFMLPELVGRISQMLNYFLVQLVGPKCSDLKVKDPDKYSFQPRKLLLDIATIITHFAPFGEFGTAVVRDERSYDVGNMRKAIRVLGSGTMPSAGLQKLEAFCNACVELKQQTADMEAELGEVPDELADPITQELMEDPVRLPSGYVLDRATICRHLLSDETDPFTRARLTVEMLKPAPEVKEQIAAFRRCLFSSCGHGKKHARFVERASALEPGRCE